MTYEELITQIEKIVDDAKYMLRVSNGLICIDAQEFNEKRINQLQRLLQRYSDANWYIKPSDALEGHVMYKIYVLRYKS